MTKAFLRKIIDKINIIKVKTILKNIPIENFINHLFLSIGISLILCNGPFLQTYLFAFLNSGEPSLYSSIYGDGFAQIPSVSDWISPGLALAFFLASLTFSVCARKINDSRDIFIFSCVYFFIFLMGADVINFITRANSENNINLAECLVANLVGSMIISGFLLIIFEIQHSIVNFSQKWTIITKIMALTFPIAFGLSSIALASYALILFYKPTQTKIDVVAEGDVSLYYEEKKLEKKLSKDSEKNEEKKTFGILRDGIPMDGNFSAYLFEENHSINWNKQDRSEKYNLTLAFLVACSDTEKAKKLVSSSNSITIRGVDSVNIRPSGNLSLVYFAKNDSSKLTVTPGQGVMQIWLNKKAGQSDKTSIALSNYNGTKLSVYDAKDKIEFILRSLLLDKKESGNFESGKRNLKININKEPYDIELDPGQKTGEIKECLPATLTRLGETNNYRANGALSISDIMISIHPDVEPETYYTDKKSALELINAGGNTIIDESTYRKIYDATKNGEIEGAVIRNGIKSARINNEKIELAPLEQIYVKGGDLQASLSPDGQFHVYGNAETAYRGNTRLNMTRWERIDTAIKAVLLSAAFASLGGAFTFVVTILRRRKPIQWL